MTVLGGATILVAVAAFIGAIYSIWRNGRHQSDKYTEVKTELKTNLKTVTDKLDNPDHGLQALGQKLSDFKVHCAHVSTSLTEKVKAHDNEIAELKSRKRSRKTPTA